MAGVLTGIGAAAEIGATHPDKLWIFLPAGFLVVGIVCAVLGTVGGHLTPSVTGAHARTLHDTACLLIESLSFRNQCNYAVDGHLPKEAFHAHYPELVGSLAQWDNLRQRQQASEQELRNKVHELAEAHGLEAPQYEVAVITDHVQWLVDRDLREGSTTRWDALNWVGFRTHSRTPGAATGSLTPIYYQTWVSIPPLPDETDAQWNERAKTAHAPVDAFYEEVQGVPEFRAAADSIRRVREFRANQLPELVNDLRRILEMEPPPRTRKCPTC